MKKIKVKMIGSGTEKDPYRVDLPTWRMIGTPNYSKMTCEILMLEDEVYNDGSKDRIRAPRIRVKYKNWKNFNAVDVETQ